MKQLFENIPLVKNADKKRFELEVAGNYAFINYGEYGQQITLVHTEVEPELAGKGASSAVIEKTLEYIKTNNLKLLPFCPLVFKFIKKNPEWKQIVSTKFKGYDQL